MMRYQSPFGDGGPEQAAVEDEPARRPATAFRDVLASPAT